MRIYFDQDGVLAKTIRKDFMCVPPKHHFPGYFQDLEPDKQMARFFRKLFALKGETWNNKLKIESVNVLTTVDNCDSLYRVQVHDKIKWMDKYVLKDKNIKSRYYLKAVAGETKAKRIENLTGKKLTKDDVLIDDYNKNLRSWRRNGGTAIKYLNSINTAKSWDGPSIKHGTSVSEKLNILAEIQDKEKVK